MRYTDIVWDFDGTLFDSYPNSVRAFSRMLKSFGCEESEDFIRSMMVVTMRHAITYFGDKYGLDQTEMHRRHKEYEGFHPELVKPYPGIPDVLWRIKESGRRNHLFTNRNIDAVRYLEAHRLLAYFDGLVTSERLKEMKPSPYGMYLILERYQKDGKKVLMVGDRDIDLTAAKRAGADACFYNTNCFPVPENADFAIDRIEELPGYL